jgi:hypothetical protein
MSKRRLGRMSLRIERIRVLNAAQLGVAAGGLSTLPRTSCEPALTGTDSGATCERQLKTRTTRCNSDTVTFVDCPLL